MNISAKLDQLHAGAKANRWLRAFSIFCRIALAAGFIPSGFVKIMGERFTALSNNHPMGHYLEALHHTGYYYTSIGILQVTAAILLLIPRTAVLGALIYFPIILNICVLSLAVRFEGSLLSSPLMVLANLYLLCWYYDRLKHLFPWYRPAATPTLPLSNKFPLKFFAGVVAIIAIVILALTHAFDMMPHNTMGDCTRQCADSKNPGACNTFCDCIHNQGKPLDKCLDEYHQAVEGIKR
jgi:uncharacterized membrane protein YphA (DoxX/SURF4 family)